MSLFGIFYTLFGLSCKAINATKNTLYDTDQVFDAIEKGKYSYLDHAGRERLVKNDKLCYSRIDMKTRENILVDEDGNVVINFSERRRNQRRAEAERKHYRAYEYTEGTNWIDEPVCHHREYIDLKTGEKLMVVTYGYFDFYVNFCGFAVAISDGQYEYWKTKRHTPFNEEDVKRAEIEMEKFNKRNRDWIERFGTPYWGGHYE